MHGHATLFLVNAFSEITEKQKQYLTWAGIGVAALVGLVILAKVLLWVKHWWDLHGIARELRFDYSRRDIWQLTEKCAFLPLFSKSTRGKVASGVAYGAREGVQVKIFDYKHKRFWGWFRLFRQRTTIVLFEMGYNFPFFYLRRERFSDKLAALVGHNDIDDFSNRKFASRYYVKSADRQFAHDLMTDEMVDLVMTKAADVRLNVEMTRALIAFHAEKRLNKKKMKWLYDFAWEFWSKTPEEAASRSR